MSTICGKYVRTFAEADTCMLDGVSLNAPYPFFWMSIVKVEGREVYWQAAGKEGVLCIEGGAARERSRITMDDPIFGKASYAVLPFKRDDD